MKRLILIVLSFLVLAPGVLCGVEDEASFQMKGGRFYWVTHTDLNGDGGPLIFAGGQVGPKKSHRGYIGVYREEQNRLVATAEDVFSVSHKGSPLAARVRAVVTVKDPKTGFLEVYAAGRGGTDETGIGFLRKSIYIPRDKKFKEVGLSVFHSPGRSYTHGYPLAPMRLTGEPNECIVYGGFSGGTEATQPDKADVRVFRTGAGENLTADILRPFESLSIPLRVNALAVGDVDGDRKDDIVIAGRTKTADGEKAAFACWSNGNIYHHVLTDEEAGRFRTLLIADLDGDGKMEIITGGRSDVNDILLARLECWHLEGQTFKFRSRYTWSCDGSTRLRDFIRFPGKAVFYAVGRTELAVEEGLQWQGFVRPFVFEKGRVLPAGKPVYVKHGWETRIRHAVFLKDRLLTVGFCMNRKKKDKAFITIIDY
jgi:hypothetical protein